MGGGGSRSSTGRTVAPPTSGTATPMTAVQVDQSIAQAAQQNAQAPASINATQAQNPDIQRLVANQDAYMLQNPDADLARSMYISKATDASGYSMSQNLNYNLEHGNALNGNESFMYQNLRGAMQQLGVDMQMNRGAHADVVQALGVQSWSGMSAQQLSQALTGASWTSNSFTSASYDQSKNPFFNGPNSGGREVVLNMHVSKQTRVMMGARSQAEIVADVGTHFRVTGAGFTGKIATPRNGRAVQQIYLDVEVW